MDVIQSAPPPSKDLEHVTEEMYKKNAELAQRNQTLSLLRKIDDIILSSVTDPQEIAVQVANLLLTEAGFPLVTIYLLEKQNYLMRIANATSQKLIHSPQEIQDFLLSIGIIPLTQKENLLGIVVSTEQMKFTDNPQDIATHHLTFDTKHFQEVTEISSFLLYPLRVREQIIGAMCIGLSEKSETLSEFEKDLLSRLANVIGIALDNAILYNQVQQANKRLNQLDKLKDEFVSLASHELRTPMTAIKSYLWMTLAGKGGPLTEKQKYYLDRVYNSTDRLIKLVNDMLNVSRIESGRVIVDFRRIDLGSVAQDILLEVKPRADELGITITLLPSTGLSHVLRIVPKFFHDEVL